MQTQILMIVLIVAALASLGGLFAFRAISESRRRKARNSSLRSIGRYETPEQIEEEREDNEEELLIAAKKKHAKKTNSKEPTVDELLFMAGRLSQADRDAFFRRRRLAPLVFGGAGFGLGLLDGSSNMMMMLTIGGLLMGFLLPMRMLRGWVKKQHEELSYYLPLLIEQVSIGVSSSLDIGPCISQLVQMADERNSHNAATDLLKYALFYVKSGVSLEQALTEIGQASGQNEFKQALLALAQVAKFGGEVSKQLQELAESVAKQREAKIEVVIRKLELKATGPVALVFLAYVLLLGLGIAAQVMTVSGS